MKKLLFTIFAIAILLLQCSYLQGKEISDSAKTVVQQRISLINEQIKYKNYNWRAGITSKSYLSREEMLKLCGLHADKDEAQKMLQRGDSLYQDFLKNVKTGLRKTTTVPDWLSMMTFIENQECSNCWAYAAAAVTTGLLHYYYSSNEGIDLYEMNITDNASCGNCDGTTWLPCGLYYIYNNKVSSEPEINEFPNYDHAYYKISSYTANTASIAAIKSALQSSPVLAAMYIYADFYDYNGGIYQHTYGDYLDVGHAVVILGYDDNDECWICRNSWGTDWGEIPPGGGPYNEKDISELNMVTAVLIYGVTLLQLSQKAVMQK